MAEPNQPADDSAGLSANSPDDSGRAPHQPFDLEKRRNEHWVWQPVHAVPLPSVQNGAWPTERIDRFILAALERAGLAPAAPADKRRLIRRVYFDLVGLPPAPSEVDEFLGDDSSDAFLKVVDRLLASPHFGERWGRHWLDLVRYAETRGHEFDPIIPNAYQYRDYVVRAFNSDVPYDQFVVEHVAGDLIEPPRLHSTLGFNESILGTGFWCLGEELHSPVDIRGDETDRMDNKIDVYSKAFLGLTVSCARCHDHKFDAISMQDYYALAGFLLSSSYRQVPFEAMEHERRLAHDSHVLLDKARAAIVRVVAESERPAVDRVAAYLLAAREATQRLAAVAPADRGLEVATTVAAKYGLDAEQLQRWTVELERARQTPEHPFYIWSLVVQMITEDSDAEATRRIVERVQNECAETEAKFEQSMRGARVLLNFRDSSSQDCAQDGIIFNDRATRPGDVRLSSDPARPIAEVFQFAAAVSDPAWDVLQLAPDCERDPGKVAWLQSGRTLCTPAFTLATGKLYYLVRGPGHAYAAVDSHRMIAGPLHGALTRSWDAEPTGNVRWVEHDLSAYRGHRVHIEFTPSEAGEKESTSCKELALLCVVESDRPPGAPKHPSLLLAQQLLRHPTDSISGLAHAYKAVLLETLERLGSGAIAGSQDPECSAWLATWIVQHPDLFPRGDVGASERIAHVAQPWFQELAALQQKAQRISHTAPALLDGNGVNESVLQRGNHRNPGKLAPRRFLEAIAGPVAPEVVGSGRLELAREMTDPADPLLARVLVNRVWQHLFGRGIVASVDNFGALGDRPTHPELLDDLARQFVDGGWSVKQLIRQLVLSSTYQMSVQPDPHALQIDPQNLLLQHMPVRRLEGEVIRDAVLAVSGRLDSTMFGPSVELHLTPFMEGRGRPTDSGPLDGSGRRSIYLRVRRNFPNPMLSAFDAPTPFSTMGRRSVSNVPAQALTMMNSPFVVEQSERWASQILRSAGRSIEDRVSDMYRAALARPPSDEELEDSLSFLADQSTRYDAPIDEPRVWTDLCHVLLNVKEFIFIE